MSQISKEENDALLILCNTFQNEPWFLSVGVSRDDKSELIIYAKRKPDQPIPEACNGLTVRLVVIGTVRHAIENPVYNRPPVKG